MKNDLIALCQFCRVPEKIVARLVRLFTLVVVLSCVMVLAATPVLAQYKQRNLVSDKAGLARHTDPNLIDAWGMVALPNGGGFVVANALSGTLSFYAPDGKTLRPPVIVPPAPGLPPGTLGSPVGLTANPSPGFVISKNGKSAPALFMVSTLDGLICGWNPKVDPDDAVVIIDNSTLTPFPASYTDLTMARNKYGQMVIYAVDSGATLTQSNNDVEIYDSKFNLLRRFTDPTVPSDMTAFAARIVNRNVYITYAGFTPPFGGVVDIYDTEGNFLRRFAANGPEGPLHAPWEAVLAPANFGWVSHQLLIGEVGSGDISVFNPTTGGYLGQLTDAHGRPIFIEGVWTLSFARPEPGDQPPHLYFTSGDAFPPEYYPSLFGVITVDDGNNEQTATDALPTPRFHSRTRSASQNP